jgi:uncharacterized membrane protein YhhN
MKPAIFLILFFMAGLAEIFIPYSVGFPVHFITKPLILIFLIQYYAARAGRPQTIFVFALIACLTGDTLLLMEKWNELYFLTGLGSFFIAHILFSVAYRENRQKAVPDKLVDVQKARLSFPILLAGTGLVIFMVPFLGPLNIPVVLYSLILIFMVLSAVSRLGRASPKSFWLVFSGATLFMISDSILAINKFSNPVPSDHLLIMGTYVAAQFLIAEGMAEAR